MILKAENIIFQYRKNGHKILSGLSISIESGEIVGLSGPSGSGKTTLCKVLAGYIKPDSGQVTLDGRPLHTYTGYCPVQMVWQHPELVVNPRLRMHQILNEAGDVDDYIIESLGIEKEWMSRYPIELSGGELQRFCIARALGRKTKFLIADEITAMFDLISQAQVWKFLKEEITRRNLGVLAVSHSEMILDSLCTRRIYIPEA